MDANRLNYAKYQIFRYAETLFVCLCDLTNPEIEEAMNIPSHGLSEKELIILLYELFSEEMLVAKSEELGLFTPSLEEIEIALKENKDYMSFSKNTFYGITTGAMELFHELKVLYENKT